MESERNVKRTSVRLAKGLRLVLRGRIWYAETCLDSHQRRISLETGDFDEAKRLAFELKDRPAGRPKSKAPASKSLTMGQASERYEAWYRERYKASGAYK